MNGQRAEEEIPFEDAVYPGAWFQGHQGGHYPQLVHPMENRSSRVRGRSGALWMEAGNHKED